MLTFSAAINLDAVNTIIKSKLNFGLHIDTGINRLGINFKEIPESLYLGMKDFISANPDWDQFNLMSSALANFLFQNGCGDRAVTERYLNDLFTRSYS